MTRSSNFPTTAGAFRTTPNDGYDAFVAKLNPSGTALAYSTFLGGVGRDEAQDIATDGDGTTVVTGWTESANFPTTEAAFDDRLNGRSDVFVTRLNQAGSALVWSTYLGERVSSSTVQNVPTPSPSTQRGNCVRDRTPTAAGVARSALIASRRRP